MSEDLERALRAGAVGQSREGARAARERLVAGAQRQGLVDVAYAIVDSPLGALVAARTPVGLAMLSYEDGRADALLESLAARLSPRVLEAPARLDETRRELEEYFCGRRRRFELAIDWSLVSGFAREVLASTAAIPFGQSRSYSEVASAAGSPRAWRATGNALGSNPMPIVIPCHRVLRSGGGLGGYTGGGERKRFLLALEGVEPAGLG